MQINNTAFCELAQIEFPMIMAPMFLVSNQAMMEAAMHSGILGVFPTLNYRNTEDLKQVLRSLNTLKKNENTKGNYGVNLIVQKSNPFYESHLELCVEHKVPFYITSLGNPQKVIEAAHAYGAKVFCDVTNIEHAEKVHSLNCDGFIAVGQGAGGHAGPNPLHLLVLSLKKQFPNTPVVAAGGIASGQAMLSMLSLGAVGVSVGTRFIASAEAGVNEAYKQAVVDSNMNDIVLTTKISGTPCTVINTPYAKKIGTQQNFIERILSNNKTTRKYFKMWIQYLGMKKLEQSVLPANYKTLWCAGQSVELIDKVLSTSEIVEKYKSELNDAFNELKKQF
jgi:nitronate monooxygenase